MALQIKTIGVIGGGAWGTALAQVFAGCAEKILLWARENEVVQSINAQHENTAFLPGVKLCANITAHDKLAEVAAADLLILVVPTQFIRPTLSGIGDVLNGKPVVICSKGIEIATGELPSEIVQEVAPQANIAVLTGPTFAIEVARGQPGAVTIAANDIALAKQLQDILNVRTFRSYASNDMVGAQVGAAIKNVIAIACGISHGKNMGENARAAIMTRGLAEMSRLALAMGGRRETLMGLCGMGDLVLTCSSMQSRNFSLGAAIGQGQKGSDILKSRNSVAEGVYTAQAAVKVAKRYEIDMPICEAISQCLEDGFSIDTIIETLLNRSLKEEIPTC